MCRQPFGPLEGNTPAEIEIVSADLASAFSAEAEEGVSEAEEAEEGVSEAEEGAVYSDAGDGTSSSRAGHGTRLSIFTSLHTSMTSYPCGIRANFDSSGTGIWPPTLYDVYVTIRK